MGKIWIGVIAFVGGVFVGTQIAKAYAQSLIKDDINSVLKKVGVDGGVIEETADKLIVPQ